MADPASIQSASRIQRHSVPRAADLLELTKPITWFPPVWAYMCGMVTSGVDATVLFDTHAAAVFLGLIMAGPAVCGTSQVVNDWFDRHVDAINQPGRPIPSGRVGGRWGLYFAIIMTVASLALSVWIGSLAIVSCCVGLGFAWAYSAPPLRLKQHPILGAGTVGICYEGLPWVTAAALATQAVPAAEVFIIAGLYSCGAYGIMVLNDFKAVRGDRLMGVRSLPALLGVNRACRVACLVIAIPQALVVAALALWDHIPAAGLIGCLLLAQCLLMRRLLRDPERYAIWYSGYGVLLFVTGMLTASFALGEHSLWGISL